MVYHGPHEWLERAPRRKSEVEKLDEEACVPPRGEISFRDASFACFLFPLFISLWLNPSCSLHRGYSLMFFIKLTLAVRGTLSPRCLHNIVYNSGCAEFHFILAGGPYTYRSLVCSLSSLFRPSPTLLLSRSNCLALSSRGVPRFHPVQTFVVIRSWIWNEEKEILYGRRGGGGTEGGMLSYSWYKTRRLRDKFSNYRCPWNGRWIY